MRLFATSVNNSALNIAYAQLARAVEARNNALDDKTRARKTRLIEMVTAEIKELHDQVMWAVIDKDTDKFIKLGGLG